MFSITIQQLRIYFILLDNIPNIAENYFYFRHSISLAFLPPGTKGSLTDGTSPSAHDLISQIQQERLVLRGLAATDLLLAADHRQRCPALHSPFLLLSPCLKAIRSLQSQSQQTSSCTIKEDFYVNSYNPYIKCLQISTASVWCMVYVQHYTAQRFNEHFNVIKYNLNPPTLWYPFFLKNSGGSASKVRYNTSYQSSKWPRRMI